MERRDFLKYFGIGATVVPLAGGLLVPEASAKLVEIPKVQICRDPLPSGVQDLYGMFTARAAVNTIISMNAEDDKGHHWKFVSYIDQLNTMSGDTFGDEVEVTLRLRLIDNIHRH